MKAHGWIQKAYTSHRNDNVGEFKKNWWKAYQELMEDGKLTSETRSLVRFRSLEDTRRRMLDFDCRNGEKRREALEMICRDADSDILLK